MPDVLNVVGKEITLVNRPFQPCKQIHDKENHDVNWKLYIPTLHRIPPDSTNPEKVEFWEDAYCELRLQLQHGFEKHNKKYQTVQRLLHTASFVT